MGTGRTSAVEFAFSCLDGLVEGSQDQKAYRPTRTELRTPGASLMLIDSFARINCKVSSELNIPLQV